MKEVTARFAPGYTAFRWVSEGKKVRVLVTGVQIEGGGHVLYQVTWTDVSGDRTTSWVQDAELYGDGTEEPLKIGFNRCQ